METWREIQVRGVVQGVGFRPAVWRHATSLGLAGGVRNTLGAVSITIGGPAEAVAEFERTLPDAIPPVAHIESVESHLTAPLATDRFTIWPSEAADRADAVIPPDLATCEFCLSETLSAEERRHRYAFTACTQCGPRYTIVESLPYDRQRTTMRDFPLCEACLSEYNSPADRRYHAESTACPICGPQLRLLEPQRPDRLDQAAFERAIQILHQGGVGAIKGIGGFHLCCDALQANGIQQLRARKRRPHKPFAVMARDLETARRFARISDEEARLLQSPQRPIVLLQKRDESLESLAPANARLGIMLPYTPLHHLLLRQFDLLVMTSANESEEPIFSTEEEVAPWLGRVVDFILTHNRRIWNKCDDSVVVMHPPHETLIRRARGYVPLPVRLTTPASREVLCCGGDLKNVFALVRNENVYLSTHMGDLENAAALENYTLQIERMKRLLQIDPALIVHDLHPGYHSTQYALQSHAKTLAVQHHHAHLAACLAENRQEGPAIGLIFDGTGYGPDGTVWGGEFLVGDARDYRRIGSFLPIAMPGGERAIHQPWRMALAALMQALEPQAAIDAVVARLPEKRPDIEALASAIQSPALFPLTSSAGRQFDIMAFLLGAEPVTTFEAQHALWLENLALHHSPAAAVPRFAILEEDEMLHIDPSPFWRETLRRIEKGDSPGALAAAFHQVFITAARDTALKLRERTGISTVACSGGVFLNSIIAPGLIQSLTTAEFTVLTHRLTPPGDGCIALGQAAIAASMDEK